MDIVVDAAALGRRQSTKTALKVLEAAIEQVMGYPVQIQKIALWASPMIFEEGRVPERMTRLGADGLPQLLEPEVLALLDAPPPPETMPSAAEYIRRAREKKKADKKVMSHDG